MDVTDSGGGAPVSVDGAKGFGVVTGFVLGLFGYLLAAVAFGYEGLFTGSADPHDQLAAGLMAAYLVAALTSAAVLGAAWWIRRRRALTGLLCGMAVGVILMVLLSVRIFNLMADVSGNCPCDPIVDQLRFSHQQP